MSNVVEEIPETKRKLLDAAVNLMLRSGFASTTVDQICAEAGVTKGGFFHYFKSKEEIGLAAIRHFGDRQNAGFAAGGFAAQADPLDRIEGLLDFLKNNCSRDGKPSACLVGNLTQELAPTHEAFREACQCGFASFATMVTAWLEEARQVHEPVEDFDPQKVGWLLLTLVQGSLLVSKALGTTDVTLNNVEIFRDYVRRLFGRAGGAAAR